MRTRAEKNIQLRNALIASAVSAAVALIVALIARFSFVSDIAVLLLVFMIAFAATLFILIILWKKTDAMRCALYLVHCIKHPASERKYYCPCCGRHVAGFKDLRLYDDPERYDPARFKTQRQDLICPFCYSSPRQRIIASWGETNKDTLTGSRILYFAPEYSMLRWLKHNSIKVTTADLFASGVDLKLDITDIDLPDGSYDLIICNHVLEHVSSYKDALNELHRILTPDGLLIISFPIDPGRNTVFEQEADTPEERIRLFGQNDHVRVFGSDSKTMLESYGFNVDTADTSSMPESILPVTGPADYDSDRIFICRKKAGTV